MIKLDKLIDKVLEQIQEDVNNADFTAIEELIKPLPEEQPKGFVKNRRLIMKYKYEEIQNIMVQNLLFLW